MPGKIQNISRAAAALVMLLLPVAAGLTANHGLFIGTSRYTNNTTLPNTRFDANDMQKTMITTGMLKEENSKLLAGKNTKQQILDAVAQQGRDMKSGDVFYIYNASHGNGSICAYDGDITPGEMAGAITKSGCGSVVIMNDSCHSEKFVISVPGKKICHINASSAANGAYESKTPLPELGHINGVFTKQLIAGLHGAADADGNGRITTQELTTWIQKQVADSEPAYHNGKEQGPNMVGDDLELAQKDPDNGWQGQCLVPDLVDLACGEAESLIRLHGLAPIVKDFLPAKKEYFLEHDSGKVKKQIPRFGMMAVPGSFVEIHCLPSTVVTMPAVTGIPVVEARSKLVNAGLQPLLNDSEGNVTEGYVVKTTPCAGTRILASGYVWMTRGDQGLTQIPDIIGLTRAEAAQMLADAQLQGQFKAVISEEWKRYYNFPPEPVKAADRVHMQAPSMYSKNIQTGTVVEVYLWPAQLVKAPDILGLPSMEAVETAKAAGFVLADSRSWNCATTQSPRGVYRYWSPTFPGVVYAGVEFSMIPDIIGMTRPEAESACKLAKLCFRAEQKDAPPGNAADKMFSQSGRPGRWSRQGKTLVGYIPITTETNSVASTATTVSGIVEDGKNIREFREWLIKQLSVPSDMKRGDTDSWPTFPALPISASVDACGCSDWTDGSKRPKDHPDIEDWCNAAFSGPSSTKGGHSLYIGILRYASTNEAVKACQWFSNPNRLNKGVGAVNSRENKKQADIRAALQADKGDENRKAPAGTPLPENWAAVSKYYSSGWSEYTMFSQTNWCRTSISTIVLAVTRNSGSTVIHFRDYNMKWGTTIGGIVEQSHQKQTTIPVGRHVVILTIMSSRAITQKNSGRDSTHKLEDYEFPKVLFNKIEKELSAFSGYQ